MVLVFPHKEQIPFSWKGVSIEDRIKQALGSEFFSELTEVSYNKDGIQIHGYIAKPTFSRPTRTHQFLFVNSRPVQSLAISSTVKEAYGSSIDQTRHPAFVLYIDIAANTLDVNVHPQKKEVRFSFEEELKQAILTACSKALFSQSISYTPKAVPTFTQQSYTVQPIMPKPDVQMDLEPVRSQVRIHTILGDVIFADIMWPEGREAEGLYLISAKRARAKLALDMPKNAPKAMQTLLVPEILEVSAHDAEHLKELIPSLQEHSFSLREFGRCSFMIEGIPAYIDAHIVKDVLLEILDDDGTSVAEKIARACKTIKRDMPISLDAAHLLVKKLIDTQNPFTTDTGEKIITMLTKEELEKKFR